VGMRVRMGPAHTEPAFIGMTVSAFIVLLYFSAWRRPGAG
jgi:hypothetical protein